MAGIGLNIHAHREEKNVYARIKMLAFTRITVHSEYWEQEEYWHQ